MELEHFFKLVIFELVSRMLNQFFFLVDWFLNFDDIFLPFCVSFYKILPEFEYPSRYKCKTGLLQLKTFIFELAKKLPIAVGKYVQNVLFEKFSAMLEWEASYENKFEFCVIHVHTLFFWQHISNIKVYRGKFVRKKI